MAWKEAPYYECPACGFRQRSRAKKRIKCHKCGRSYKRRGHEAWPEKKEPYFATYGKSDKSGEES